MPRRQLGCLLLLLPVACSLPVKPANFDTLPLPDSSALPCCWQSHESLRVDYRDQRQQLTAVTAMQSNGLTLIVFDPLGRRLLTVTQQGSKIAKSVLDNTAGLPVEWLLPAIYLSFMDRQRWALDQSPWRVGEQEQRLILYFRQRPAVSVLGFTDGDLPQAGKQRIIRFPDHQFVLRITTLSSKAL